VVRSQRCANLRARLVASAIMAVLGLVAGVAPASAQRAAAPAVDGTVKGQFGDWQVVCKAPPPGAKKEICAVTQSVTDETNENVGLTVMVQNFATEQVLRVMAPLGVLLPRNLALKVDEADLGQVPFMRCFVVGCQAQIAIDDALRKKLTGGKTALFVIFRTEEQGIGIPISLTGLNEALASLK
jgi:invasion protein IalB